VSWQLGKCDAQSSRFLRTSNGHAPRTDARGMSFITPMSLLRSAITRRGAGAAAGDAGRRVLNCYAAFSRAVSVPLWRPVKKVSALAEETPRTL
jgi:hypothetical protein